MVSTTSCGCSIGTLWPLSWVTISRALRRVEPRLVSTRLGAISGRFLAHNSRMALAANMTPITSRVKPSTRRNVIEYVSPNTKGIASGDASGRIVGIELIGDEKLCQQRCLPTSNVSAQL